MRLTGELIIDTELMGDIGRQRSGGSASEC